MTITIPTGSTGMELGKCSECENDTFHLFVKKRSEETASIEVVKCAVCGDGTQSNDFN